MAALRVLPYAGPFDTVKTEDPVIRRALPVRLFCTHFVRGWHIRVDHRTGTGSFADKFEGTVCCACGAILRERQML